MASSSYSPPAADAENTKNDLVKRIRSHEIAIAELNNLPQSRAVYQKNSNIFFRKSVKSAVASEQKQLDAAKAQLQKLDAVYGANR